MRTAKKRTCGLSRSKKIQGHISVPTEKKPKANAKVKQNVPIFDLEVTKMPNTREKLIELIGTTEYGNGSLIGNNFQKGFIKKIADHLIANGVTVQKWIPVSEPPEENRYYLCYVLTNAIGEKAVYEQMPLYWEDDVWLYRHNSYRMCRNVTHWMPLPEPPKGE